MERNANLETWMILNGWTLNDNADGFHRASEGVSYEIALTRWRIAGAP